MREAAPCDPPLQGARLSDTRTVGSLIALALVLGPSRSDPPSIAAAPGRPQDIRPPCVSLTAPRTSHSFVGL